MTLRTRQKANIDRLERLAVGKLRASWWTAHAAPTTDARNAFIIAAHRRNIERAQQFTPDYTHPALKRSER